MSDDVRLGLIIGGALLVVGALLWRSLVRRHELRALVRTLGGADSQTRARAGIDLVDLGLSRAARPLLRGEAAEPDSRVRLAIALAVGRRQWEPSNTARVRRVREWAALELELQGQPVTPLGPAVTRLSDMGGPRLPEAEQAETPAAVSEVHTTTPEGTLPAVEPAPEPLAAIHWGPGASPTTDPADGADRP
jgi:hypothetical protein